MRRFLPLGLAALAIGCSGGSVNPVSLIQPDVHVHHLALRNVGLSGGTLDIALAFHNPNKLTLQGTRLTAGLDVQGNHFGDVDMTSPFSLAGRDTTLLTVPLTFRWSGVGAAAKSILDFGAVDYDISGRFSVVTPVTGAALEVPFTGQGNVPLIKR